MFIRGMEGVFVTLNPSNKLFIFDIELPNKVETKLRLVVFCHIKPPKVGTTIYEQRQVRYSEVCTRRMKKEIPFGK